MLDLMKSLTLDSVSMQQEEEKNVGKIINSDRESLDSALHYKEIIKCEAAGISSINYNNTILPIIILKGGFEF